MKSHKKVLTPNFELESQHNGFVCGLDEVGRGPLSGPVVAACVHVPAECKDLPFISEIRDSKVLTRSKIEYLYTMIDQYFVWSVACVSPQIIDEINILNASLKAMHMAYGKIYHECDHALIDGKHSPPLPCPSSCIVKGDNKSISIASASIMAKVTRDNIMRDLHNQYPHYGWDKNVGYASKHHRAAILKHGITPHHRKTFGLVRKILEKHSQNGTSVKGSVTAA